MQKGKKHRFDASSFFDFCELLLFDYRDRNVGNHQIVIGMLGVDDITIVQLDRRRADHIVKRLTVDRCDQLMIRAVCNRCFFEDVCKILKFMIVEVARDDIGVLFRQLIIDLV